MVFSVDLESGMVWYGDEQYKWEDCSEGHGYWFPVFSEHERELGEALARAMQQ